MDNTATILNRRSIRLKGYDYSKKGLYFITLCCEKRRQLFGEIINGKMELNEAGKTAHNCWQAIPDHFPNVQLEEFVIMPDHVHGVLRIILEVNESLEKNEYGKLIRGSIGSIIKGYKIGVTKWFRINGDQSTIWQRNYYEVIIRNPADHGRIEDYIRNNPKNWKNKKRK